MSQLRLRLGLLAVVAAPVAAADPAGVRVAQPVHDYAVPFGPAATPEDRDTYLTRFAHLGTDYGPVGPAGDRVTWEPGGFARIDTCSGSWGGLWHSLAGVAREPATLDFARGFPPQIADRFQPSVRAVTVRGRGAGRLRLEVKDAAQRVLWHGSIELAGVTEERAFPVDPARLPRAKCLNWVADLGANLAIDAVGLTVEFPPMPFADRVFLVSYAKLARCAAGGSGWVKDQGQRPAGRSTGCRPAGCTLSPPRPTPSAGSCRGSSPSTP